MKFSPFSYLRILVPLPLLVWYWAGQALHKMELEWARAHPGDLSGMEAACHAVKAAGCEVYLPTAFAHGLSLFLLLSTLKLMLIVASMEKWPQKWQKAVMRHAGVLGGIGLMLTLLLVIGRGVASTLAVWFIPKVWWNYDATAVVAIIGMIVLIRIPPHLKTIWSLMTYNQSQCVGKAVSREEAPRLWEMVDDVNRELGTASPDYLVLGLMPDCRLHISKVQLLPEGRVVSGDVLYLGTTLSDTLPPEALRMLLRQALSRRYGKLGAWFPAIADWLKNAETRLSSFRSDAQNQRLAGASAPAFTCLEGWLTVVRKMLTSFEDEYQHVIKSLPAQPVEHLAGDAILSNAREAWRSQVMPRLMLGLSNGARPKVLEWFAEATDAHDPDNPPVHDNPALHQELILLERQWLIDSGQITVLE